MHSSSPQQTLADPSPQILVLGFGAAGQPFATGLAAAGARVTAVDPAIAAQGPIDRPRLTLCAALPARLDDYTLVISILPAALTLAALRDLAGRGGNGTILDLSSSDAATMRLAAEELDGRLVDGVILGAVGLTGHTTPLLLAGGPCETAESILTPLGARVTVLPGGRHGDAGQLKLLRSLFTKTLEALVVELNLAADALGLQDKLPLVLGDLRQVAFIDFMDEMLRTHPRHAGRRAIELEAAQALLAGRLPLPMAAAGLGVLARAAAEGPGPDASPRVALDWLRAHAAPVAG
ncbi:NAD(P)-dependent oxidoreductase [Frigidibacter oleivorans]|uniref:NAD(P)-dependent oxidoreductase n=1 Tax=Frigidibacter oleivorans TaxID=2487129 RepID=UPI000F8DBBE8|nr:NAD(P)-dependent oxidoreductase [Frigidibacter oleivorans]